MFRGNIGSKIREIDDFFQFWLQAKTGMFFGKIINWIFVKPTAIMLVISMLYNLLPRNSYENLNSDNISTSLDNDSSSKKEEDPYLLRVITTVFEWDTAIIRVIYNNVDAFVDINKAKDTAEIILQWEEIIQKEGYKKTINANNETFKSLGLSINSTTDDMKIAQIYTLGEVIREIDSSYAESFYQSIKWDLEERYFLNKEDFFQAIGKKEQEVKRLIQNMDGNILMETFNSETMSYIEPTAYNYSFQHKSNDEYGTTCDYEKGTYARVRSRT